MKEGLRPSWTPFDTMAPPLFDIPLCLSRYPANLLL